MRRASDEPPVVAKLPAGERAVENVLDDVAAEAVHDWLDEKPPPPPRRRRNGSAAS